MHKFFNTIEETATINIQLSVAEDLRQYQFLMLEITRENEYIYKSELNKTIFSTLKRLSNNLFIAHIETFDRDFKNKMLSITEKEFVARLAEINDDINLTILSNGKIKAINNLLNIQEKAKSKIAKLGKSHKGEAVEERFNFTTTFYENEKRVILDVESYKQLGLLLNNFYAVYAPKIIKKNIVRFLNFMDDTLVNVEEVATIHKIDEDNGTVTIKVSGEIIEPLYKTMFLKTLKNKSIMVNENIDKPVLKKYEGFFMFDSTTGVVKNAKLDIEFAYGIFYNKIITYQLNEMVHADNN
jgi:hypothetical protein